MKNLATYLSVLAIALFSVSYAQDNTQQAIDQGKSDLIEILTKAGLDFDFGIDAEEVRASRNASAVSYKEMDFEKLLNYDQQGIDAISSPTQKLVVPMVQGGRLVTTITLSEVKQGTYKASELISQRFQDEMNQLPSEATQNDYKNITIIYVPNLNTTIYQANGKSYSSYDGRSLRDGTDTQDLLQAMKVDAISFQQQYGQQTKDGKLLN